MSNLKSIHTSSWAVISLINLVIVGSIGVMMRYKIGFEFPYLDQRHLQQAHSNFAFYGWVSHTLMVLMSSYIRHLSQGIHVRKYYRCILINLIASYGMLFSFAIWGYHPVSIFFSTSAMVVSYFFTYFFIRDFRTVEIHSGASLWFRAALISQVISSIGNYSLAYMMFTHTLVQHRYLLSVYFYLHFQYNGWFFFTLMGLAILMFRQYFPTFTVNRKAFWMMALSCAPAYFLSALWLEIPIWVYVFVIAAAIIQVVAWCILLKNFTLGFILVKHKLSGVVKWTCMILALAISLKLLLQLGSVIPAISKLAFGFRSIIIAYLHLILLAIISVFLVMYMYDHHFFRKNKITLYTIYLFVAGVYLNELFLGIQGIASFVYFRLPFWNEILFVVSLLILLPLVVLLGAQIIKKHDFSQT